MDVNIPKTSSAQQNARTVSGGRQHPPRSGSADGSAGRIAGGGSLAARPRLDASVVNSGYRWWYIDAISDDGLNGFTLIAFVFYYNLLNLGQSWVAGGLVSLGAFMLVLHGGVFALTVMWLTKRHYNVSLRSWLNGRRTATQGAAA